MNSENLVSPLINAPDFSMENGYGGGGGIAELFQNPQVMQQWRKQSMSLEMQNHDQCFPNGCLVSPLKYASDAAINHHVRIPVHSYQSIAAHVEKEKAELDQYIKLQSERLKWSLEEQIKQRFESLLKRLELKTLVLLRQKDEEIITAARKRMDLEQVIRELETENQIWQRIAQEKEAMVISLTNTIDQMRETAPCFFQNNAAEDGESCCDVNGDDEERFEENRGATKMATICVVCNSQKSSLLFLPCRHLCSCKSCETGLNSCPVCGTGKKATIEALIFWGDFAGKGKRKTEDDGEDRSCHINA